MIEATPPAGEVDRGREPVPPARRPGDDPARHACTPEAEEERRVVRFGAEWRTFIRRQNPDRLTALDEMIEERIERRALVRFYRRVRQAAVAVAVAGFAIAEFGIDRLPVVRQLARLLWHLLPGDLR